MGTSPAANLRFAGLHAPGEMTVTVQNFCDLLTAKPFKPFRLVLSSGQAYDVRHPEVAFLSRTSIYIGIDVADDNVPADYKMCSLLHVTAVEPLNTAALETK
jgi:hypothetical protein